MTECYDSYTRAIAEMVNDILKQEFLLGEYTVNINTMKLLVEDVVCIYNIKRSHFFVI